MQTVAMQINEPDTVEVWYSTGPFIFNRQIHGVLTIASSNLTLIDEAGHTVFDIPASGVTDIKVSNWRPGTIKLIGRHKKYLINFYSPRNAYRYRGRFGASRKSPVFAPETQQAQSFAVASLRNKQYPGV